jgi:hypothetical protein
MTTVSRAITFDEIDHAIHSLDLSAFQAGGVHHLTADAARVNPTLALATVCSAYHAIEPFFLALADVPLLSARWKQTIVAFTSLMNAVCAGTKNPER